MVVVVPWTITLLYLSWVRSVAIDNLAARSRPLFDSGCVIINEQLLSRYSSGRLLNLNPQATPFQLDYSLTTWFLSQEITILLQPQKWDIACIIEISYAWMLRAIECGGLCQYERKTSTIVFASVPSRSFMRVCDWIFSRSCFIVFVCVTTMNVLVVFPLATWHRSCSYHAVFLILLHGSIFVDIRLIDPQNNDTRRYRLWTFCVRRQFSSFLRH